MPLWHVQSCVVCRALLLGQAGAGRDDGAVQEVNRDTCGTPDQRPVYLEGDAEFVAPQTRQLVEECPRIDQRGRDRGKAFGRLFSDRPLSLASWKS